MVKRHLELKIKQWSKQYPVVTVTGPRQSGKTTLCRALFKNKPYVSLEDIDNREYARTDPRGFLSEYPDGALLDEIQNAPDLVSYIQTIVDDKQRSGMFILTGSRQFEMMEKVSQSLAGRTAVANLFPFSFNELYKNLQSTSGLSLDNVIYTGFYPRIHDKKLNPTEAYSFYVSTYLERDVRKILAVADISRFETFLRLCAGRTGQLLNLVSLGNDCGVSHNTVKSWISVLQASGILKLLLPWHVNVGKRMIKSPKLYFIDTGLACCLLGIHNSEQLRGHPLRGALFETFIVSDAYKQIDHSGGHQQLWFCQDSNKNEIDLLVGNDRELTGIEIKSAMTVASSFFKGFRLMSSSIKPMNEQVIVYGGEKAFNREKTKVIPWRKIGKLFASGNL